MRKRAILYARVSGDDRKNATSSIDSQLVECRKFAEHRGYDIVGEAFEDPDKHTSGADWLPELDRLLRLAPSGTFDVLICREVDRLARNRFKQLATEIELENHCVRVEYAIGQFEDTDEGRLLKGLVSEFAEFERSKIRRRTNNGKLRSVEAGNVMIGGSIAPYGYDIVEVNGCRTLDINDHEAEVVRMIFGLYGVKTFSMGEIADYLDEHKVPLPSKGNNHRKISKLPRWSTSTIAGLLDQETYVGHWHYRKTRVAGPWFATIPEEIIEIHGDYLRWCDAISRYGEAQFQPQLIPFSLLNLAAVSSRRMQAIKQFGGSGREDFPIYSHLHNVIYTAAHRKDKRHEPIHTIHANSLILHEQTLAYQSHLS